MTAAPGATSPASQVGMEGEARNETMTAGERAFTAWAASSKADATPLMWTWEEMPEEQRRRWANIAAAAAPAPTPAVQSGAVAWRTRMRGPFIRPGRTAPGPWTLTTDGHFSERYLEQYEVQALGVLAAPQSEPLPGGVGEATLSRLRLLIDAYAPGNYALADGIYHVYRDVPGSTSTARADFIALLASQGRSRDERV